MNEATPTPKTPQGATELDPGDAERGAIRELDEYEFSVRQAIAETGDVVIMPGDVAIRRALDETIKARDAAADPVGELFVRVGGPDKRGMLGATVVQALAAAKGETVIARPLLRPDQEVSPGVSVSDEGYRFETLPVGVVVFGPDGSSIGAFDDQRAAEVAAGAHYMSEGSS